MIKIINIKNREEIEMSEIATRNPPASAWSKRAMLRSKASGTAIAVSEHAQEPSVLDRIKSRNKANLDIAILRAKPIIGTVKKFGDKALIDYTKKFDCFDITKNTIEIKKSEIEEAYKKVDKKLIKALEEAAEIIKKFCKEQLPKEWSKEIKKGIKIGQIIRPLEKVGCYVPGGKYSLVSTVLMAVIPAKVAGVKEIVICSPPRPKNYALFVAADIAGADKIFRVGGAQAIAALAYGTETIPKVDKIVGPGNIFVTAAKKLVYGDAGIDFLAGPTEVVVLAEKGNPKFIAADLLAQAEHDRMASAILVTTNKKLAEDVKKEVNAQLKTLKTELIANESIRKNSAIILAGNIDEAINLVNDFAPEHLIIEDKKILDKINNAGAIFIGSYSCEAAGDYCVGNHVLPTGGIAKFRAGLSVLDFIKMPTVQELSKEGLKSIKEIITELAKAEGLDAHKKSVEKRFENGN